MKMWGAWIGILVSAVTTMEAQTTSPVLSSVDASYPTVQGTIPINIAGNIYAPGQVAYGPTGTPLKLSGSGFGDGGSVWFVSYYRDPATNQEVQGGAVQAHVIEWSSSTIEITVPVDATSGLIEVISAEKTSNSLPFLVTKGAYSNGCPAVPSASMLQITSALLANGVVNQSYSTQLQATGGSNSYIWMLTSGTLPAGLSLSPSGTISGIPTSASGSVDITVQVTDASSPQQHDVATLSIEVDAQAEGSSSTGLYNFSIRNTSGGNGYDAVGNVTAYSDSVNGTWSFSYDSLNRLVTASGSQADNPYPNYCWQYDSFGNRLGQTSASAAFATGNGGANGCTIQSTAGSTQWAQYNANNQMSATSQNPNQGQYYDAAGNATYDGLNSYLYDAEGRICAVQLSVSGIVVMTQYLYDAEGNRVAKGTISSWSCDTVTNGFTATTAYVLGPGGEQLSELTNNSGTWQWAHTSVYAEGQQVATYDADPAGQSTGKLYFHLSDWLGTRRQQTDYAGNPVLNFTGLPFGDGLTTIPVSSTDATNATEHHFTGKERDSESGNDYFGARYYTSSMGRMLSPDPHSGTLIHQLNPQRWNMYAYALNNPLTMTDPTGKDAAAVNFSGMVGGLGHEAIIVINPDGSAELASFGPAVQDAVGLGGVGSEPGQVQTYPLPTVQFGANGLPTDASMAALKSAAANDMSTKGETVNPNTVRINYFKTTPQETANLNAWIAQQKSLPNWYSALCIRGSRNCATFTQEGLVAGGAITQSQANKLSIDPNLMFLELQQNCHTEQTSTTIYDRNGNAIGSSQGAPHTICN